MSFENNKILVNFQGAAGNQFGLPIYTTMIPFNTLDKFFKVFPNVQRKVNKSRVKSIANYIIKGAESKKLCFLSAITVTCKGDIEYNDEKNLIGIDINTVFSINDGQHRAEGIKLALETSRKDLEKALTESEKKYAKEKYDYISNMTIPVVIFSGIDEIGEQQLFHDLNLLAAKPNKSIALRFDSTDLYNRLAKKISKTNDFLQLYGVETEKTQLKSSSSELMVLSTLRNMISYIISGSEKDKFETLNMDNFDDYLNSANDIFDELFGSLPEDCTNRDKYIIGTAATLQGIGKYIYDIINDADIIDWKSYIRGLKNIDWKHENSIWQNAGGSYIESKKKFVFTGTSAGINGVAKVLKEFNRPV
ncbi:DNA sulfur modification protein DndB [Clostridium pascui]|uniref:DNA sulfur modification protein DndB n=1 Tax=Clostridium pascui TaxID=46609 RepID=UPI0019590A8B|nr:DNA sulfur modification protein DndB [Clostridium pascui]MBM7872254.1 DNA sulfur modification protein DndB [Clostridium pascui]